MMTHCSYSLTISLDIEVSGPAERNMAECGAMNIDPSEEVPRQREDGLRTFDPAGLTAAQLAGYSCISCRKRWPRPSVLAGHLPGGRPLYICEECVALAEPVTNAAQPSSAGSRADD